MQPPSTTSDRRLAAAAAGSAQGAFVGVVKSTCTSGDILRVAIGMLATPAVINQLIRRRQRSRAIGRGDSSHRRNGQHLVGAGLTQRPHIGAVIDAMRRKTMRIAMTRQKKQPQRFSFDHPDRRRRGAVRGVDRTRVSSYRPVPSGRSHRPGPASSCAPSIAPPAHGSHPGAASVHRHPSHSQKCTCLPLPCQ